MRTAATLMMCSVLALLACGGGGGSGGGGGEGGGTGAGGSGSQAPVLRVSAQAIKTLAFDWQPAPGATHYRLFEDVDGGGGPQPEQLLGEPAAGQEHFTLEDVFLPERVNARYRLEACTANGCTDSAYVGIDGIDAGIGYFKAQHPGAGDRFGESMALSADGQVLAVGVPWEDGLNAGVDSTFVAGPPDANVGAVYVFRRAAAGWVQDAYIKPFWPDPILGAQFGRRVAVAGDAEGYTLLVGAPQDPTGGSGVDALPAAEPPRPASGAAYLFERTAQGEWIQAHYIKAPQVQDGAWFGWELSLTPDRQWAAVGQPLGSGGGSVALYRRSANGWELHQEVKGSNTESGDEFGAQVQLDASGAVLVVAATAEDGGSQQAGADNTAENAGAVYVFERDGSDSWEQSFYLKAPQPVVDGYFGDRVVLSEGAQTIVIQDDTGLPLVEARVHVFQRQGSSWTHETVLQATLAGAGGRIGDRLAISADGRLLAIAIPGETTTGTGLTQTPVVQSGFEEAGTVYLYRRNALGAWSMPQPVKAPNNQYGLLFGWSLALSANGDTLAVYGADPSGSPGIGGDPFDTSTTQAGAVYLY